MATIPLAKSYDATKLHFPVYVSRKLDGVPVRIDIQTHNGKVKELTVRSRQDKPVHSVQMQAEMLAKRIADIYANISITIVAEVTHDTLTDFKDVSGIVRRHQYCDNLVLNLFDLEFNNDNAGKPFDVRIHALHAMADHLASKQVSLVTQWCIQGEAQLNRVLDALFDQLPDAEGFIVRSHDAVFKPGARLWDYQKVVRDPTVDLRLHSVEEAVGENGDCLNMVGRLNFWYKGKVIGVGPGKLTHGERTTLWAELADAEFPEEPSGNYPGPIATIKYKTDSSYEALRQPTFQHWRPEKDTPSYE